MRDGLCGRGVRGDPAVLVAAHAFLTGFGAAAGIGLVNSFGSLSGFVGPFVTGWPADLTGDSRAGMWVVAAMMVMSASVALAFRGRARSGSSGSTKS